MLHAGVGRIVRATNLLLQWHPKKRTELRSTAWLDGLRGVAALEVLIYHYVDKWIDPEPGFTSESRQIFRLPFLRSFYDSGRAMVCTFFIISGFVLTQRSLRLLRRKQHEAVFLTLASAVFRRALRLFPPALFPIAMGFVLVRLDKRGERGNLDVVYLPRYDSVWLQAHHWFTETTRYLSIFSWYAMSFGGDLMHKYEAVVWTLPLEFYCSMVIYIILIFTGRMKYKLRRIMVVVIAVYALIQGCWSVTCFCYGLFLADFNLGQEESRVEGPASLSRLLTGLWSFVLFSGIWIAGAPQRGLYEEHTQALGYNFLWALLPEHYVRLDVNYTLWSFAGIMIATSTSQLSWVKSFLETSYCQYLGQISFSLYLNHVWIRDLMGPGLQSVILNILSNQGLFYGLSWLVWMAIIVPINFVVAGWFERLVDAPVVRFARTAEAYVLSLGNEEVSVYAIAPQQEQAQQELPYFTSETANGTQEAFQMVEKPNTNDASSKIDAQTSSNSL